MKQIIKRAVENKNVGYHTEIALYRQPEKDNLYHIEIDDGRFVSGWRASTEKDALECFNHFVENLTTKNGWIFA